MMILDAQNDVLELDYMKNKNIFMVQMGIWIPNENIHEIISYSRSRGILILRRNGKNMSYKVSNSLYLKKIDYKKISICRDASC